MAVHFDGHLGRSLRRAVILVLFFALFELGIGVATAGLAISFDALHNGFDCLLLGLNSAAHRWSRDGRYNIRTCRVAPSVPPLTSGLLIGSAVPFAYLAVQDLDDPGIHHPGIVLVVALVSLGINVSAALPLHDHREHDANARSAWTHLLADSLVALAAVIGCLAALAGYPVGDPIAALVGAVIIVASNVPVVKSTWRDPLAHIGEHTH